MYFKACTTDDIPLLVSIATQSYFEHYRYLWLDEGKQYVATNFNADQFEKELMDTNAAFFLIVNSNAAVGILKFNIDKSYADDDSATSIELERLYFVKDATGKGYGKEAINFSINFAREKKKTLLWLRTMSNTSASEFYMKQGFIVKSKGKLNFPLVKEEHRSMLALAMNL